MRLRAYEFRAAQPIENIDPKLKRLKRYSENASMKNRSERLSRVYRIHLYKKYFRRLEKDKNRGSTDNQREKEALLPKPKRQQNVFC